MEEQAQRRDELQAQLIERASRDPAFRQELLADPNGVIAREYGTMVPASVEIRVVEETPSTAYLVLPPAPVRPGQELSDRDLEAVAGGTAACSGSSECEADSVTTAVTDPSQ